MSALPTFHTKAVAEKQADKDAAVGTRDQASEFLSELDELLAEDADTAVIEAR